MIVGNSCSVTETRSGSLKRATRMRDESLMPNVAENARSSLKMDEELRKQVQAAKNSW